MSEHTRGSGINLDKLGSGHSLAIILAAITGVIHLYLGIEHGDPALLLAGAGFFGAVVLFLLGIARRLLYAVGIVYTAAQLVLWWAMGAPHLEIAFFDKVVQVSLIVLLAYLYWNQPSEGGLGM